MQVEIQKLKKKSDEANTLNRDSKVNSHCGMSLELPILKVIKILSLNLH